jgi:hypothetical protein
MKESIPYQMPYLENIKIDERKSGSQDLTSIDLGSHETLTDISPYVKVEKIVGLVKPEPGETRSAPARLTHRYDPCSTEDSALLLLSRLTRDPGRRCSSNQTGT